MSHKISNCKKGEIGDKDGQFQQNNIQLVDYPKREARRKNWKESYEITTQML